MPDYILAGNKLQFRQSNLPITWMIVFAALDIHVGFTDSKIYPYEVGITESDFNSAIELAED